MMPSNSVLSEGHLVHPSKIICVGRNYVEHIHELGGEVPEDIVFFSKPNSSITNELRSSHRGDELHYEGEISFMYGDGGLSHVGFGLDLTKRSLQSHLIQKGLPWERCKAFSGSALFSEFVRWQGDFSELSLRLDIDGDTVQSASAAQMLYDPEKICDEASRVFSLNDGDIIMTGTPKGVGPIQPGSRLKGAVLRKETILTEASWVSC